jgi:hypothetical protein
MRRREAVAYQMKKQGGSANMRPKWAFQLLPNKPDVLGKGYRVDPDTQLIEDEVNTVLQCKFGFHGIIKLVIRLGPKDGERDYYEQTGVAQKYYPGFDIKTYNELSSEKKKALMRGVVLEVFDWLITNFEDAQCFDKARKDLGWPEINEY